MSRLPPVTQKIGQNAAAASGEAGASIILAVVLAGAMGVIAMFASRFINQIFGAERHLEMSGDRGAIASAILATVDCGATIAANALDVTACDSNVHVGLVDFAGNTLVSSDNTAPSVYGDWTVRARCYNTGTSGSQWGLQIEAARPFYPTATPLDDDATPSHFRTDPATSKPLDWSGTNSKTQLFAPGFQLCRNYFFQATATCPAATSISGGIQPINNVWSDSGNQVDPAQATTPFSVPGTLVSTDRNNKRRCHYSAPLVHGGNSVALKGGPSGVNSGWQFYLGPGVNDITDHYGNVITCPANWRVASGGGVCDYVDTTFFGGGWNTASIISLDDKSWNFQCAGFIDVTGGPNQVKEAANDGVIADCVEL